MWYLMVLGKSLKIFSIYKCSKIVIRNGGRGSNCNFSILQYLDSHGRFNRDFGVFILVLNTEEPIAISYEYKVGFV